MLTVAIVNGILALGVIVMVVAPLVWAILTQHRDRPGVAAVTGVEAPRPQDRPSATRDRRSGSRPSYKPLTGRA